MKSLPTLVFQVNHPTKHFPSQLTTNTQHDNGNMFCQNISFDLSNDVDHEKIDTMDENKGLSDFEYKCPPGGQDAVIIYTTSLRGIRKTFEDCSMIRFLVESFGIVYYERDVSLHIAYRDELWRILGGIRVVPPRLFVKGRHIGGADEVVGLHEQGILKKLLHGIPLISSKFPCKVCCGIRFVMCLSCHGCCKITDQDSNGYRIRCPKCNENGLIKCPVCN
ncbi:hypothetical protein CQW23_03112 [Capsicum baccatum]|uniref:Glutaredoxin domain-containing protein n=1 Tax=Capsicum baccatum TaxID=33114 RepID=A0A2G2XTI5_CAPBA|nr:hypothetical protein CQW23_03112 [Capsicum baccatum]